MPAALGDPLPDFDTCLAQVTERQSGERERLDALRARCLADRDEQARKSEKVEAKLAHYVGEGDDAKAYPVLPMVERERQAWPTPRCVLRPLRTPWLPSR